MVPDSSWQSIHALNGMLRSHLINRVERAMSTQPSQIRATVRTMLDLPDLKSKPLNSRLVSTFERDAYTLENILFESIEGWEVNASVFIPKTPRPPKGWPAVVVPCGHSWKSDAPHQTPCQILARAGYLAITFDPPGQGGEKTEGNDHFRDAPRCLAVGHNSQRYFVADALRSLDYLQARSDVDPSLGFAITGVSGGGVTSIWAALIDDRIKAVAPACCLAEVFQMPVANGYACCPEPFPIGRLALGLDDADLAADLAPTPLLCITGQLDQVYTKDMFTRVCQQIQTVYSSLGHAEKFNHYAENSDHDFTPTMTLQVIKFFDQWFLNAAPKNRDAILSAPIQLEPVEAMLCSPATEPNMRTLSAARAARLVKSRPRLMGRADAARAVQKLVPRIDTAHAELLMSDSPAGSWSSKVQEIILRHETDILLPATLLRPGNPSAAAMVLFDDKGRWNSLRQQRWAAGVSRFLDRSGAPHPLVMSVDLRGWGETAIAPGPFDLAGWSAPDRWASFISAGLGDGLLGQRVRDAVASIRWLLSDPAIDPTRLVIAGVGVGGIVALLASAMFENCAGVICVQMPASIAMLVEARHNAFPVDVFQPRILEYFDLPELIDAVSPVLNLRPCDAEGRPTTDEPDLEAIEWAWRRMRL